MNKDNPDLCLAQAVRQWQVTLLGLCHTRTASVWAGRGDEISTG